MSSMWPIPICAALLLAACAPAQACRVQRGLSIEAFYPEGPESVGRTLYWAEMPMDRVRRFDGRATTTIWEKKGCGPTAVRRTPAGDFWILCHLADKIILLDSTMRVKREISEDEAGNRLSWPNDGKVDRSGRLYFSSAGLFDTRAPGTGYVVTVTPDGPARRISGPYHYANGIALSADGKHLYLSEHLGRRVWRLDLEGSRVTDRRIFFDLNSAVRAPDFARAGPDGLLLTPAGDLWIAEYGAGRLLLVDGQGRLKTVRPVETPYVTNLARSPFARDRLVVVGTYDLSDSRLRGRVTETPASPNC